MKQILPSELENRSVPKPNRPIAVDTETSGLFVDAGARVSTVSVAWIISSAKELEQWRRVLGAHPSVDQYQWSSGIWTLRKEECGLGGHKEVKRWVLSMAWSFDQGTHGKDDVKHVENDDTVNLGLDQFNALLKWLNRYGSKVGLTMHNAKFDLHVLTKGLRGYEDSSGVDLSECVDWDSMLGADLWIGWRLATTKKKPTNALKDCSGWLWGEGETDEQQVIKKYLRSNKLPSGRWDLMPWGVVAKYADQDARLTCRLRFWQEQEQERVRQFRGVDGCLERGWKAGRSQSAMQRRMEMMKTLFRVEQRGLPFSVSTARESIVEIDKRIEQVEKILSEKLGKVTLPNAKHFWFGEGDKVIAGGFVIHGLGLPVLGVTAKGEPSVDQATLLKMQRDNYPLVNEWVTYKKLVDARSRWYEGWSVRAGADERLRTSFRQVGTASGRFSVEEIQLQAIPANYKVSGGALEGLPTPRQLIGQGVPEGYKLMEMDLAQAELRVAANMAKCTSMLDLIISGEDLHGYTAKSLFNVDDTDPDWYQYRQIAKRGNFSLIFGVGWKTFSETLWKEAAVDWGETQTKAMIAAWHGLYPEFRQAIKTHERVVIDRFNDFGCGWIQEPISGERRWFTAWDVLSYEPGFGMTRNAHKAFNQRVQPALAQYGVDRWIQEEKYLLERSKREGWESGTGLVLMVHDSTVLLLPEDVHMEVCQDLKEMGESLWKKYFPGLPGELDISPWKG